MEKTTATKMIYQGKIINLRVDDVELTNGSMSKREIVEHPGAVAILAITAENDVFFVRQYRKPIEKQLLEIPAGKLDDREDPADCAVRELAEEVGMKPNKLRQIAFYYSSPGFATEKLYIFLATELEPADVATPEDEILEPLKIPFSKALSMARQGQIEDGKTLVALLLAADLAEA